MSLRYNLPLAADSPSLRRIFPSTSILCVGVLVPNPTRPLPLTNNILEEAGELTRSKVEFDGPERSVDPVIWT